MNKAILIKTLEQVASNLEEDMALVNRQAIKELAQEDVFLFSAILCDNAVDRDYERFSDSCLEELSEMFVGKTGIFNHNWDAAGQVARIYKTAVEKEGELVRLRAYAYILRDASAEETIRKIEGGILKEVSVGVTVERTLCSICGKEISACSHKRGEEYDGTLCYGILDGAKDAYEFSFVAVPAQPAAGVTKQYEDSGQLIDLLLKGLEDCPDRLDRLRKQLAETPPEPQQPPARRPDAAKRMTAFFYAYMANHNMKENEHG